MNHAPQAILSGRGYLRHSFSAFPDGWPGSGLLLLRITIGLPLLYWGIHDLLALRISAIPELAAAAASFFVIAGLYTAVAGSFIAFVEALMVFLPAFAHPSGLLIRVFLVLLGHKKSTKSMRSKAAIQVSILWSEVVPHAGHYAIGGRDLYASTRGGHP